MGKLIYHILFILLHIALYGLFQIDFITIIIFMKEDCIKFVSPPSSISEN